MYPLTIWHTEVSDRVARINGADETSVLRIKKFLGLNENPDGDTTLKTGEMSTMRNFRITQDNHLQTRPGCKTVINIAEALNAAGIDVEQKVYGAWYGSVNGKDKLLVAYDGHIVEVEPGAEYAAVRGHVTADETHFFGFGEKVYLLNGHEYMSWDGSNDTEFTAVVGYVPLVQIATTPDGDGTLLENINRLSGKRRVSFSPDGTAKVFKLPEKNLSSVISATVAGAAVSFTANVTEGSVEFSTAPAKGTDTLEVLYDTGKDAYGEVSAMRYSELFNGGTDARVFLYGDGSNKAIYSGTEYSSGQPSAEYFPDLFELSVGESNTPITSLTRHYSRMMVYKTNSAWVVQYGTLGLADDTQTAAFYVQPVNRQFGNDAMGQVKLLENSPISIDRGSLYQWKSNNSSGYIGNGESNAQRVSDRISISLQEMDLKNAKTVNCKHEHEFWILSDGIALILNYANNTWYKYTDLVFDQLIETETERYGICHDGRVVHFSNEYRSDDGKEIDCYAATGAMDFGRDWQLKYSSMLFVAMQPKSNARISVTVESDRKSDYAEKVVAYSLANFAHADFNHFSFSTNRKPQVSRLKMKVKKATYYRLIFKSKSASSTATVIETDIEVRFAGSVK